MADQSWAMKGELVLSCNCTVFCPCVLSLGSHPPTEGYCQTWAGFRVDSGHFGEVDLSGLNLGLIMEIPGYMSRGNWTAGLFIDKRASIYAVKGVHQDLHRQGRRHDVAAVDPGRQVPRRRAGADHLRDQGQDAALPDPEDHRRRGHADRRQGPRARHDDREFANTGSRRRSSSPRPTRAACGPSAATGISPAARPKSASWIGADRETQEGHLAAGARIFGPSAYRIRLLSGVRVAGRGQRGALDRDVLVARPGAASSMASTGRSPASCRSRRSCRPGRATCSTTSSTT